MYRVSQRSEPHAEGFPSSAPKSPSIPGGSIARRGLSRNRRYVHIFARTRIVQLLARLLLNGFFVRLQSFNVLGVEIVLLLLLRDSFPQRFILGPLLFVDDHAIRPEHHVHK